MIKFMTLFALMLESEDEDDDKVSILKIRDNLKDYILEELKSFATILINSVYDLTKEKDLLNECIDENTIEKLRCLKKCLSYKKDISTCPLKIIC